MKLPDLLFGVATSDHQSEAFEFDRPDIRDDWESVMRQTLRGRATDFCNRYGEDIRLAKDLGCRMFRFSISWARVERSAGSFDNGALDHYERVVSRILEEQMVPVVTLHHFTWPIHVQGRGGMIAVDFPNWFENYVKQVVNRLGDTVPYWITFNEPNLLLYGYIKPWWQKDSPFPPGITAETPLARQLENVALLMRNLFVANRLAVTAIKARNLHAKVGANPFVLGLPSWMQKLLDWLAKRPTNEVRFANLNRGIAERRIGTKTRVDLVLEPSRSQPARQVKVSYSKAFRSSNRVLVKGVSTISSTMELRGRRVGFVRGSIHEPEFSTLPLDATAHVYPTYADALAALESGSVEAVVGNKELFEQANLSENGFRFLPSAAEGSYRASVGEGNPDLLAAVNAVASGRPFANGLKVLKGGPIARIRRRRVLKVGITGNEPAPRDNASFVEARRIASAVASEVLGGPANVSFVSLPEAAPEKALTPWYQFLDPFLKGLAVLTSAINGNWWHLGMCGKLPKFLCPTDCVNQQDFVGFDYYWGINTFEFHRIYQLLEATMSRFANAPVDPPGLFRALKRLHRWFPSKEILIIEHGCINFADGFTKARCLKEHLRQVERARCVGIPVAAYICWSITSNREWGLPFSAASDFGLYHIKLDSDPALERIGTDSAETYKRIIRQMRAASV